VQVGLFLFHQIGPLLRTTGLRDDGTIGEGTTDYEAGRRKTEDGLRD
jgi:hypothetical protein